MKSARTALLLLFSTALAPAQTLAQDTGDDAVQDTELDKIAPFVTGVDSLDPFLWTARPLIVFADTPNDPRFMRQMELLEARPEDLLTRQVVVITDTDPGANGALRAQLRPRGFVTVLVGKDGEIKLRKPSPWSVRELSAVIDKMPLRRDEIIDAKRAAGEG